MRKPDIIQLPLKNVIGKRIQEARIKLNLTQDELATKLQLEGWQISRTTLSKIEAEIREVRDYEILVLARILKVPVEWLLSGDETFKKITMIDKD